MAISETTKINILINKKYKNNVLNFLQTHALMQIDRNEDMEEEEKMSQNFSNENESLGQETTAKKDDIEILANDESTTDYDLAGVKFALSFLAQYDETKVPLAQKLAGNKIKMSEEKIEESANSCDYKKITNTCQKIESGLAEAESKLAKLNQEKQALEPWRTLKIAPNKTETEKTRTIFGMISDQKYLDFINKLEKETKDFAVEKIHTTDRELFLAITLNKDFEDKLNKVFNDFGFNAQELPYSGLLPQKALDDILTSKHLNIQTNEKLKKEAKKLTEEINNLKIVFDWLTWKKEKLDNETKLNQTKYTYLITGWIERINLKAVHNKLQKITKNNVDIKILELTKKDVDSQPVVIRNKKFWKNFEAVTGIYGLPKASEVDPTVFLAPFFIVFFGFCLTDAGYGIILSLLAFAAIKIMKVPREDQKLFRVLFYGGIVTFFLGILFGGWFGIVLEDLPNSGIKNVLLGLRQIDPMKNPLLVLGITFVLGIIQVWTGIIIAMWWQIKQGKIKEGILSHGVWVYFIPAIIFWAAGKFGVLPESLIRLSSILLWIGVATMILTQGRAQKSIIAKLGTGLISLYGLVGYLSDVLSYSRLLALGLATGIIAMVINLIAVLFRDMIPYVGWLVMILILIGGHLFNIVINVLGAFIHSGRLQFVEFFPKFMEGGGSRFKPLKRESKYIEII